nr:phosphoribosylaminoimidazolesuccinocarboxamide synthase [Pyrinomonadaceae bacterium]
MGTAPTISNSKIPGLKFVYRGKVRDIYEIDDDTLLLVATDRLSAFDCILPTPIEKKGAVLTQLSAFWFKMFEDEVDSHFITADFDKMPPLVRAQESLRGRSTLVKRAEVFPVECVVRGYLEGSGWKDYKATGKVSGHDLPRGLVQCDRM